MHALPRAINQTGQAATQRPVDRREALLVAGLELARRAVEAETLEDLYFLVTNDVRTILEFDRSFLLTHFGGSSAVSAAGHQPTVEKKSAFYEQLTLLAGKVKFLSKPLLLSSQSDTDKLTADLLDPEMKSAVMDFMAFSKATGIFIVPLKSDGEVLGHLAFEFLEGHAPDQLSVLNLLNIASFLAAGLAKRWFVSRSSHLLPVTEERSWTRKYVTTKSLPALKLAAAILGLVLIVLFLVPMSFNVGGEAEVVSRHRHVAFCQVEGIIDKILVTEGATVTKGQVVAVLDPTELDHKITLAVRQVQFLSNEAQILENSSFENVAKLAEAQISILKRKRAEAELDFLRWQRRFIEIKAPADGVVVTKQIESMVGKKFTAGESFCEIASPGDLCTEIWVPEDRATFVEIGQEASLYLNSDPFRRCRLRVTEVAPKSEPAPRVGNVYRVRGSFVGQTGRFSVGQKGTGSICTGDRSLWFIISQRVGARWNEFSHHLL